MRCSGTEAAAGDRQAAARGGAGPVAQVVVARVLVALAAILAMFLDETKALTISAGVGLVGSVIMGVVFLFRGDWWIVFIAGMLAHQNYRILQQLRQLSSERAAR